MDPEKIKADQKRKNLDVVVSKLPNVGMRLERNRGPEGRICGSLMFARL